MRKILSAVGICVLLTACSAPEPVPEPPLPEPVPTLTMTISSPAFGLNEMIPVKYTCDGENVSPPLQFSDVPEGTKSIALIVDDPDAPRGDWVHWVVYGIDPATTDVPEGIVPTGGIEGVTNFKKKEYKGPCPPSGTHRYFFKMYALGSELDFKSPPTKIDLLNAMRGDILESSELIGLYTRK